MTTPGWEQVGRSFRHDGYRIDPADSETPGGWVLRVDDPEHPVLDSIDGERFTSLKAAKAAATHHRLLTIRRTKLIRHGVLAVLGVLVAIPAFALMGPGSSDQRLAFFVVGLAVLLLTLRELVGLLLLVVSDGWDYGYDRPTTSVLDRTIVAFVGAMAHPPIPGEESAEPIVHVVDLDD